MFKTAPTHCGHIWNMFRDFNLEACIKSVYFRLIKRPDQSVTENCRPKITQLRWIITTEIAVLYELSHQMHLRIEAVWDTWMFEFANSD